jgi:hypothetical protein
MPRVRELHRFGFAEKVVIGASVADSDSRESGRNLAWHEID